MQEKNQQEFEEQAAQEEEAVAGLEQEKEEIEQQTGEEMQAEAEKKPFAFSQEKSVELAYRLSFDEAMHSLRFVDKKRSLKKRLVYTVVLGLLFLYFIVTALTAKTESNAVFLSCLCAALLAMIWVMPVLTMRRNAKAFTLIEEPFCVRFFETGFGVGEERGKFTLRYQDGITIFEDDAMLMISVKNEKIFPIPKSYIGQEQLQWLQGVFRGQLGEEYKVCG